MKRYTFQFNHYNKTIAIIDTQLNESVTIHLDTGFVDDNTSRLTAFLFEALDQRIDFTYSYMNRCEVGFIKVFNTCVYFNRNLEQRWVEIRVCKTGITNRYYEHQTATKNLQVV